MEMIYLYMAVLISLISISIAIYLGLLLVISAPSGTKKAREISAEIRRGALTFLSEEYMVLIGFCAVMMSVLVLGEVAGKIEKYTWISFLFGALLSAGSGNIGMRIATAANVRTAHAVMTSKSKGFRIAFSSGAVMGLVVCGFGLLGLTLVYIAVGNEHIEALYGFGFGASSVALFARVGGGIFTKSADVGADLVGKVERGIPEDDPRNPAVIADNVGDNVGDVAGMGADLFESYVDAIIATMALGMGGVTFLKIIEDDAVILPIVLTTVGIMSSVFGILATLALSKSPNPRKALMGGLVIGTLAMATLSYLTIWYFLERMVIELYLSLVIGLITGVIIGFSTDFFTSERQRPAQAIAEASTTGAGTTIIKGLSIGLMSTAIPAVTVSVAMVLSDHYAGLYGIALAAMGMLSTLGISLAIDTYGPVADNAAGIAEMAQLGPAARRRGEELDAVGNTTAAIGKGFAIGSAVLAALALFSTYKKMSGIEEIDISHAPVVAGLLIGGLMPFIFSALTMNSVGKTAEAVVKEVRRQFREIDGLMEGTARPDTERCIRITTRSAIRQMILPSLLVITAPLVMGFLSLEALGGFLAGALISGFLLAVLMANAGGAWDNAKKYIESGHYGGKGSMAHKAAVIGDTVGDPFKDTSGPSLNILIKLMSIVALVFLPMFM